MCGRYTLTSPVEALQNLFDFSPGELPALAPRFNIAPTQEAPVVRREAGEDRSEVVVARWGLVPHFAKDPAIGARMINARAETVAVKPSFRAAFKRRRCVVPADGFIEWQKRPDGKHPHRVQLIDGSPFGMAGLYERWRGPDATLTTYTIITCAANELVSELHDRMPVILDRDEFDLWLDPGVSDRHLLEQMLDPFPAERMRTVEVSRRINSPRHDDPACIAPVAAGASGDLPFADDGGAGE